MTPATAHRLEALRTLRCTCPPGAHTHARGRDALGVSKAALAAAYPELLCVCLVYGLTGLGEVRDRGVNGGGEQQAHLFRSAEGSRRLGRTQCAYGTQRGLALNPCPRSGTPS